MAADCSYVLQYGGQEKALAQIVSNVHQASQIFEKTLNIALKLVAVDLNVKCDTTNDRKWNRPCDNAYPLLDRLSDFSYWRSRRASSAGIWHLMTKCTSKDGSAITTGTAWFGLACQSNAAISDGKYYSGTGVSSIGPYEWKVFAHEVAHSLGADHDCDSGCRSCPPSSTDCQCCACEDGGGGCDCGKSYLMATEANSYQQTLSKCSLNVLCPKKWSCLQDPTSVLPVVQKSVCGNGVQEAGEECDSGGKSDACCDPSTCKLKVNAVCSDYNDACCNQCQKLSEEATCAEIGKCYSGVCYGPAENVVQKWIDEDPTTAIFVLSASSTVTFMIITYAYTRYKYRQRHIKLKRAASSMDALAEPSNNAGSLIQRLFGLFRSRAKSRLNRYQSTTMSSSTSSMLPLNVIVDSAGSSRTNSPEPQRPNVQRAAESWNETSSDGSGQDHNNKRPRTSKSKKPPSPLRVVLSPTDVTRDITSAVISPIPPSPTKDNVRSRSTNNII